MCTISMWWLKVGKGNVQLDGCLANVNIVGINAYLSGKGIFKADTQPLLNIACIIPFSAPYGWFILFQYTFYCFSGFQPEMQKLNRNNEYFRRKKMNLKVTSKIQINSKWTLLGGGCFKRMWKTVTSVNVSELNFYTKRKVRLSYEAALKSLLNKRCT